MNQDNVEARLAQLQERLEQLEASNRKKRRRTGLALLVSLFAGTAVAAVWPANFLAGAPAKAADLNDYLNDLNTRINAGSVPAGTIAFFAAGPCPTGWSSYQASDGRFIVGTTFGTVGRQVGLPPLGEAEQRQHSHQWVQYTVPAVGDSRFSTFGADGGSFDLITWTDGMDTAGAGNYPISAQDQVANTYFTSRDSTNLPYIQLLTCRKN